MRSLVLLLSLVFMFLSCSDDELSVEEQFAIDEKLIQDYLKANNLTAEKTPDGLYYIIENPGGVEKPQITSTVVLNFDSYFLDGTDFRAANNASITLFNEIQGLQKGIPKFGRGGKGKILIPSKFGLGTASVEGRTNAVLIFDIEVIDFDLTAEEQFAVDTKLIEDYLIANNLTAEKTPEGIFYIIENEGSAEKPKITNTVLATYKGYFLDGVVFDSGSNVSFPLANVIQGWQKGIPKFGRGGKGKLFIPSKFAYGKSSNPGRASAVLGFDVEVHNF
jgi:FKBP-type peptidyl-prolyl cis-trans isomerase